MPCIDGREDEARRRNWQLASVLCAVIRKHGLQHVLDCIDKECGVDNKVVTQWWREHEEADKRRREREFQEAKTARVKNNAILKLTPEELRALGIKRK